MGVSSPALKEAMKGNNNASKAKTDADIRFLFEKFCNHLRQGFSKDSFPDCDYRTIETMIAENPAILQSDLYKKAKREGQMFWESIGINGTIGMKEAIVNGKKVALKNFNALSWKFNMQNRFGWHDKQDVTSGGKRIMQPPKVGIKNPHARTDEQRESDSEE